jgi:SAM-dependent methyltransferase
MQPSLLKLLVDPLDKTALTCTATSSYHGAIIEGALQTGRGQSYPVTNAIPRFVLTQDQGQQQTEQSFGYKWQQEQSYASPTSMTFYRQWLVQRYGFTDLAAMQAHFYRHERILDAGCGGGYSTSVWLNAGWVEGSRGDWIGVDISEAIDVAQKRFEGLPRTHFIQADLLHLPFPERTFDLIFSEGVLHHTPSTERALKTVAALLTEGGELMFYVYRKKGPIREFTDDYIRDRIANLPPQDAWQLLEPLTKLGQALADLKAEVEVPADIPYLGIKAGRYDVQRLIYWHVMKLFWNDAYRFEENHHINFDWYHPRYAHRQTEEEVRRWCAEANLRIFHFDAQESGYTVRAIREG